MDYSSSATAALWTLWARRFRAERLAGLYSRHRGQKPFRCTPSVEARILNATRKSPSDGSTHWSTPSLAAMLGVSYMMVARVWSKHRLERYMSSNDPDFEQKSRHHRAVPEPACARGGILCGREDGDSSARSRRSGAAAVAGTSRTARRTARVRVLPARHAGAVGGGQYEDLSMAIENFAFLAIENCPHS